MCVDWQTYSSVTQHRDRLLTFSKQRMEGTSLSLFRFLTNFPLGLLIGSVAAFLLASKLDADVYNAATKNWIYLFAACTTLIGATLAIAGVLYTVDQQRVAKQQERDGKLTSARAFLPNTLSRLCEVARQGFHHSYLYNGTGVITQFNMPTDYSALNIPDEAVAVLRDVLENSSDYHLKARISAILREQQVLLSRTANRSPRPHKTIEPDDYNHATHWAYLYALITSLFSYARNEVDELNEFVSAREIGSALHAFDNLPTPTTDEHYKPHIEEYARKFEREFRK